MKNIVASIITAGLLASWAQAQTPIFSDNFNTNTVNPAWTHLGAQQLNGSTLLLTNFGGGFASFWSSNAVGLNSAVGQASFTVTNSDALPLGFTFSVGSTSVFSQQSMASVTLNAWGAGKYEIIWNNTGTTQSYSLASGSTGTVGGSNQFRVFIDGILVNSGTGSANTFTRGDGTGATAFGFWNGDTQDPAIIDDFKIYNTLNVVGTLPPPSAYLVYEDFTNATLNPTYWNAGGGFGLNTNSQNVLLSTFGSGFAARGDSSGTSGLDSNVGYASFTVTPNGGTPIGGNFIAGRNNNFNTAWALVNVPFATGGAGTYEVLWNNSGSTKSFTMPRSGWSGTIAGNSTVYVVNGNTAAPHWGNTTNANNAANINLGDTANRWGFWLNSSTAFAIIDNVRIAPTLTPGVATCAAPTLSIVLNGANVDLSWPSAAGCTYQLRSKTTLTGGWSDLYAPVAGDGTTKTLPIPATGPEQYFQLVVQ